QRQRHADPDRDARRRGPGVGGAPGGAGGAGGGAGGGGGGRGGRGGGPGRDEEGEGGGRARWGRGGRAGSHGRRRPCAERAGGVGGGAGHDHVAADGGGGGRGHALGSAVGQQHVDRVRPCLGVRVVALDGERPAGEGDGAVGRRRAVAPVDGSAVLARRRLA